MKTETLEALIVEHFGEMPDAIAEHVSVATYDLYYGPQSVNTWRSMHDDETREDYDFQDSCAIVSEWLEQTHETIWVCEDSGCVSTREPEGEWYDPESDEYFDDEPDHEEYPDAYWCEPLPYFEIDYRAFCAAYVNRELIPYL